SQEEPELGLDDDLLALAEALSSEEDKEKSEEKKRPSKPSHKSRMSKAEKIAIQRAYDDDRATRLLPTFSSQAQFKDDSDEEDNPNDYHQLYSTRFPNFPPQIVEFGVLLKLLANVYLRN